MAASGRKMSPDIANSADCLQTPTGKKSKENLHARHKPKRHRCCPLLTHSTVTLRVRAKIEQQEGRDRERKQLTPFNLPSLLGKYIHTVFMSFSPFIPLLLLLQNGQTDRFISKLNGYFHCFFLRGWARESSSPDPASALRRETALLPRHCILCLNSTLPKSPLTKPNPLRPQGNY